MHTVAQGVLHLNMPGNAAVTMAMGCKGRDSLRHRGGFAHHISTNPDHQTELKTAHLQIGSPNPKNFDVFLIGGINNEQMTSVLHEMGILISRMFARIRISRLRGIAAQNF